MGHSRRTLTQRSRAGVVSATNRLRPLPDFLVIGAQKAGTSSLHQFLSKHPELSAGVGIKEIHYFDTERVGDLTWYRSHFRFRRPFAALPLVFESTPRYLFHQRAASRISATLPDVRMIALLRSPVDRAISAYRMEVSRGRESLPMMEAMVAEEDRLAPFVASSDFDRPLVWDLAYKLRGHYAEQLER